MGARRLARTDLTHQGLSRHAGDVRRGSLRDCPPAGDGGGGTCSESRADAGLVVLKPLTRKVRAGVVAMPKAAVVLAASSERPISSAAAALGGALVGTSSRRASGGSKRVPVPPKPPLKPPPRPPPRPPPKPPPSAADPDAEPYVYAPAPTLVRRSSMRSRSRPCECCVASRAARTCEKGSEGMRRDAKGCEGMRRDAKGSAGIRRDPQGSEGLRLRLAGRAHLALEAVEGARHLRHLGLPLVRVLLPLAHSVAQSRVDEGELLAP